ncbi:hypothetical protein [Sphingomonas sp. KC8]|uniref:hypothetical protein n=1 Tax=Sphingomonas sp. KC8 TaxID=1030157 RepID=UPI001303A1EF|nr:hypothetical protein [Sphingomonas sp. KC8]
MAAKATPAVSNAAFRRAIILGFPYMLHNALIFDPVMPASLTHHGRAPCDKRRDWFDGAIFLNKTRKWPMKRPALAMGEYY